MFSKGVTDACCGGGDDQHIVPPGPPWVPIQERGVFDFLWATPIRKISDGTSNTIAVGEGAYGENWPVSGILTVTSRVVLPSGTGAGRFAIQAWIASEPTPTVDMLTYQQLSTMMGNDITVVPDN
ncbi:MAG: hypothetical protein HY288_06850 [Planctomycetia bacterium]|nr:hypothetical protein [Planctomycetia bacterium]